MFFLSQSNIYHIYFSNLVSVHKKRSKCFHFLKIKNFDFWHALVTVEEFLTRSLLVASVYFSLSSLKSQGREISSVHFTFGFPPT